MEMLLGEFCASENLWNYFHCDSKLKSFLKLFGVNFTYRNVDLPQSILLHYHHFILFDDQSNEYFSDKDSAYYIVSPSTLTI
jgi:hypothetical protein